MSQPTPLRKALTAVTAVALFAAAAGIFVRKQRGDATAEPRPAQLVAAPGPALDDTAAADDDDAKPDPSLDVDAVDVHVYRRMLLLRELFHQAFLLAQRDAGLPDPDHVLERPGRYPMPHQWHADVRVIFGRGVSVRLAPDGDPWAFQALIPYKNNTLDYADLLERAERYSRRDFRKLAATAATNATTRANSPAATAPAHEPDLALVDAQLDEMNPVSQFAAARAAHALLRQYGEREAILGCLVRAYANLGQQTQCLWSPAHKAFAARAMLYAQRMVARAPASPLALRHRAYAFMLAGLQSPALQDLDAAARLAPAASSPPPPAWVAALDAYCHYHTGRLRQMADASRLAAFLAFLSVESCEGRALPNALAQRVCDRDPDCFRAVDAMDEISGPAANHALSQYGPPALAASLATHLPAIPSLPAAAVAPALDALQRDPVDPRAQLAVASAIELAKSGDAAAAAAEPSNRTLAELVRDLQFLHAYRRADFLVSQLGVDAGEYVDHVMPAVANHRFAGMIASYRTLAPRPDQLASALRGTVVVDPVPSLEPLTRRLANAGLQPTVRESANATQYYIYLNSELDHTSADLDRFLARYHATPAGTVGWVKCLAENNARSPLYLAMVVKTDWPAAQPQIVQWLADCADHPTLLVALGRKYADLNDYPNAEKYLTAYLEQAPDADAFERLAQVYLAQGKEAQWLATLERILQQPDFALDHAHAHGQIAWHYIRKNQFDAAEPHARAAAGSGSSFGLLTAAACDEGLGRLADAAQLVRAESDRYAHEEHWYYWCRRTGHADGTDAERALLAALDQGRGNLIGHDALIVRAARELIEGRPDDAARLLAQGVERYHDTGCALRAAILADTAGDTAARDRTLDALIAWADQHPPKDPALRPIDPLSQYVRPRVAALAKVYRAAANAAPDRAAVDRACAAAPAGNERREIQYLAGKIYLLRGDRDAALAYLKLAAAAPDDLTPDAALAWIDLRRLGFDPTSLYHLARP